MKDNFEAELQGFHFIKRRNAVRVNDPKFLHDHEHAIGSESTRDWVQILIDSSHIITFCVAISVIIYGSFKSLDIDSENEQLVISNNEEDDEKTQTKENPSEQKSQLEQHQQTQDIDAAHALFIPIAASISLLLMFFFFESIQTVFLLCTSILAIVTFAFLLLPLCTMLLKYICSNRRLIIKKKYSCCFGKFTLPELLSQFFSSCLVALWIITGHWLLMDIIGIGFCITFIAIVRLPSLKVSTILLVGLVIYDVFWVYFSHLIFESNVMIKVATKQADNPFKILVRKSSQNEDSSKLSLPGKLVVPSYQNSGNFSILGLGDIVVPGLLLCFVLRFDAYKKNQAMQAIKSVDSSENSDTDSVHEISEKSETIQPHKLSCCCFDCHDTKLYSENRSKKNSLKYRHNKIKTFPYISFPFGKKFSDSPEHDPPQLYTFRGFIRLNHITYFHCAIAGYLIGLLAATISSEIFSMAQPALLFLVPFTLIPLLLMAYLKGDLEIMWNEPFSYTTTKYFNV